MSARGGSKNDLLKTIRELQTANDQLRADNAMLVRLVKAFQVAGLGVSRTFQNIRLFPQLSVFDNVRVACNRSLRCRAWHALVRGSTFREEERQVRERIAWWEKRRRELRGAKE